MSGWTARRKSTSLGSARRLISSAFSMTLSCTTRRSCAGSRSVSASHRLSSAATTLFHLPISTRSAPCERPDFRPKRCKRFTSATRVSCSRASRRSERHLLSGCGGLFNESPNSCGREGQLPRLCTKLHQCCSHRIPDRCGNCHNAAFARTFGAQRIRRRRPKLKCDAAHIGKIGRERKQIIGERRVQKLGIPVIDEVIEEDP